MRKHISTVILTAIFVLGFLVMLYPTISNLYNERMNSYVVTDYIAEVENRTEEEYQAIFEAAREFNESLSGNLASFQYTDEFEESYYNTLNIKDGAMGYLVIDKIGVNLAIYHGTDSTTLQKYIGHLEGTPLPTGDVGNNTILTGHTGLPSAELFTRLTEMAIGDTFDIVVLNETFTYQVFEIYVIEPDDLTYLNAIEGKDVVTLLTCTPYGVNSHRLLVLGERIDSVDAVSYDGTVDLGFAIYDPSGIMLYVLLVELVLLLIVSRYTWKYRKKNKLTLAEKIELRNQRANRIETINQERDSKIEEKHRLKNEERMNKKNRNQE